MHHLQFDEYQLLILRGFSRVTPHCLGPVLSEFITVLLGHNSGLVLDYSKSVNIGSHVFSCDIIMYPLIAIDCYVACMSYMCFSQWQEEDA